MDEKQIEMIYKVFERLVQNKNDAIVNSYLRLSKLPLKQPKTFENFDFSRLQGNNIEKLKSLSTLAALYEKRNIALIGPQGIGKTHLAMAFGRACCEAGLKTYFLKASELEQKLTLARRSDKLPSLINGLVKPSCLIIDEVGRCKFDKENTQIFFDIVDRRTSKNGSNTMILTSNKTPVSWGEYFDEPDSLLCALDRIFDDALVFMMKGESCRGRKLETIAIEMRSTSTFLTTSK